MDEHNTRNPTDLFESLEKTKQKYIRGLQVCVAGKGLLCLAGFFTMLLIAPFIKLNSNYS